MLSYQLREAIRPMDLLGMLDVGEWPDRALCLTWFGAESARAVRGCDLRYAQPMGEPVCYLHLLDEEGRMPEPRVTLRRAYDPPSPGRAGGRTVLVDRVWPRGISKSDLGADLWLRDLAPSDELRRWFGHRPERWQEFRRRYHDELRQPERSRLLDDVARMAREEPLTLLFGAKDRDRNQAVVIMEALEERLG